MMGKNVYEASVGDPFSALPLGTFVDGQEIILSGSRGLGSSATYVAGSSATIDEGITFDGPQSMGRVIRHVPGRVHVDWFGATVDDAADDSTAFMNALAAGGRIECGKGTYNVSLTLTSFSDIVGNSTTLKSVDSVSVLHYTTTGVSTSKLENVRLDGNGGRACLLGDSNAIDLFLENVRFDNAMIGMEQVDAWNWRIDNCYTTINGDIDYAWYGYTTGLTQYSGWNHFHGCRFGGGKIQFVSDNDVATDVRAGNVFVQCEFQSPTTAIKVWTRNSGTVNIPNKFENCWFEAGASGDIDASDIGIGTVLAADGAIQFHGPGTKAEMSNGNMKVGAFGGAMVEMDRTSVFSHIWDADSVLSVRAFENFNTSYTIRNANYKVDRIENSQRIAGQYFFAAEIRDFQFYEYAPNVRNLAASRVNSFAGVDAVEGTPAITASYDGQLLPGLNDCVDVVAASSSDVVRIRGDFGVNATYLDPQDADKVMLAIIPIKSLDDNTLLGIDSSITSHVGTLSFTDDQWHYIAVVATKEQQNFYYRIEPDAATTYRIGPISITLHDTEEGCNEFIAQRRYASGTNAGALINARARLGSIKTEEMVFDAVDTTPNINGADVVRFDFPTSGTITQFDSGQAGHNPLIFLNSNATLAHDGVNVSTVDAADVVGPWRGQVLCKDGTLWEVM